MTSPSPNTNRKGLVSRRSVLGGLGIGAAAVATGGYLWRPGDGPAFSPSGSLATATPTSVAAAATGRILPGAVEDRVLVIVDLRGGNDGLSLLAPVADGRYHDLRPSLAIAEEDALWVDDEVALHPALQHLSKRSFTTVEGVGPIDGDLSHFAMTERWERGDVSGTQGLHSGFLGRLTDALDDGSPLVGLSLSGYTNHMSNNAAATLALEDADDLWFYEKNDWAPTAAFRSGVLGFDQSASTQGLVGASYARLVALADQLATDDDAELDSDIEDLMGDGGELAYRLATAATLITSGVGTRVVYVGFGDFDTHSGHQWQQTSNYERLDAALESFLRRIDAAGASDRVLVATISEFGRRVEENDGGLDHGAASTMLLAGAVGSQQAGERPDLSDLDDDGNLKTTVPFDHYLATLAEDWLGVEAASVLPEGAAPLGIL